MRSSSTSRRCWRCRRWSSSSSSSRLNLCSISAGRLLTAILADFLYTTIRAAAAQQQHSSDDGGSQRGRPVSRG